MLEIFSLFIVLLCLGGPVYGQVRGNHAEVLGRLRIQVGEAFMRDGPLGNKLLEEFFEKLNSNDFDSSREVVKLLIQIQPELPLVATNHLRRFEEVLVWRMEHIKGASVLMELLKDIRGQICGREATDQIVMPDRQKF